MSDHAPSRRAFVFSAGVLASGMGFAGVREDGDRGLSAAEILARTARTYAECSTYHDTGTVETMFLHGNGTRWTHALPFSTAFARPSRFRFEFHDARGRRYLVATENAQARTWWDLKPGIQDGCDLETALAGATGVSGGSAHTVPALLMPDEVHGLRLTDLVALTRLDDAALDDGATCFRVQGARPIDLDPERQERDRQEALRITGRDFGTPVSSPQVLWIDRSTSLLRRIERRTAHADFQSEATTSYKPAINAALSDSQLAFDPPAGTR